MKNFTKRGFWILAGISMIVFACQEYNLIEPVEIDQDLVEATNLADEYLTKSGGRSDDERSITVFRYIGDRVYYDTNTDDYEGYQLLEEESVTAIVNPGEYIFWYSGAGISDLDGIEFDQPSDQYLQKAPEEVTYDRMWVIRVPTKEELGDSANEALLKYDILYQYDGYTGKSIRLDPQIRVNGSDEEDDTAN